MIPLVPIARLIQVQLIFIESLSGQRRPGEYSPKFISLVRKNLLHIVRLWSQISKRRFFHSAHSNRDLEEWVLAHRPEADTRIRTEVLQID